MTLILKQSNKKFKNENKNKTKKKTEYDWPKQWTKQILIIKKRLQCTSYSAHLKSTGT